MTYQVSFTINTKSDVTLDMVRNWITSVMFGGIRIQDQQIGSVAMPEVRCIHDSNNSAK